MGAVLKFVGHGGARPCRGLGWGPKIQEFRDETPW
jgi:hypothetical protein